MILNSRLPITYNIKLFCQHPSSDILTAKFFSFPTMARFSVKERFYNEQKHTLRVKHV